MSARCSHSVGQGHHAHTLPTTSAGWCGRWSTNDRGLWSILVLLNRWVEEVYSISTYCQIMPNHLLWGMNIINCSEWAKNAILYATPMFKMIFPANGSVGSSSTCKGSSSEKCGYKFLSLNSPSFQAHSLVFQFPRPPASCKHVEFVTCPGQHYISNEPFFWTASGIRIAKASFTAITQWRHSSWAGAP